MRSPWPFFVRPEVAEPRIAELADIVARELGETCDDPSLSRGLVGAAWLLAETGDAQHRRTARHLLARAAAMQAAQAPNVALFSGLTGLQWTLDALSEVLYDAEPDADADLDRLLARVLRVDRWRGDHDLVGGLVGIGVYALANPRARRKNDLCEAIVDQLERAAIRPAPEQATWITDAALLDSRARELFPRGRIDLGLAHGVPGVAAWLADVVMQPDIEPELEQRAGRLLDHAITWCLSRREADEHAHGYPYFALPDGSAVATARVRLAWCYGDLGVAWALTKAATARGRPDWLAAAGRAGRRAALRDPTDSGLTDPWLCHGGAGVAHVFTCLFRATGDAIYADAARTWWQRALDGADERTTRAAPALLEGAAGLGLALLAAIRDVPPRWHAFMLL